MHISGGTFFIFHNSSLIQSMSGGFVNKEKPDDKVVLELCKKKKIIILEEENNEKIKETMMQLNASVALPLFVGSKINGVYCSVKKDRETFILIRT